MSAESENNILDQQLVTEINEIDAESNSKETEEEAAAPSAPHVRRRKSTKRIKKTKRSSARLSRPPSRTTRRQTRGSGGDDADGNGNDGGEVMNMLYTNLAGISYSPPPPKRRKTKRSSTALGRVLERPRPLSNAVRGCRHCICTELNGRIYKLLDLPYLEPK
ncbi:maker36, partial [Drosophila busckii]